MDKEVRPAQSDQTATGLMGEVSHNKTWRRALFYGVVAGMLTAALNLLAAKNGWRIQGDFFDIVNAPLRLQLLQRCELVWFNGTRPVFHSLKSMLLLFCYWALIGLFLASLFCLVRIGVIRDITRDKICRYILFFATCAGICAGGVNFLAVVNEWHVLSNCFESFDQPAVSVILALHVRYHMLNSLPPDLRGELYFLKTALVIYWTIIGLLVALVFCVIRILKKRKAARVNSVSGE